MNLTVALLGTEIGLTRAEIFSSVTGYVEQVSAGSDEAAMGRMFERDKETLVELGTRIEVIGDVVNPRNMRDARYRIPREDNSLPDDLEFTPGELAVLSLAADAWSEAAMSREARSGLRKIRALGYDVDEPILGFTPRLDARDESFAPLEDAIARGAEVTFDYLRPGSQRVRTRRVRPRALVMFESRWHLRGRDEALGEDRTFLLSRIVSDVRTTGVRFDPDDGDQSAEQTLEGLRALADGQRARIAAVPGSEAALRLGRRSLAGRDADELVVPYVDAYVLADEIASYGPEARVIEPHELRELVRDRLRAVRILHSRPADLRDADEAVAVRPARRRSTDGAERVRIYLTLVPWLLERADVTVADAAAEFGVTPAELRKMLATLSMVGEPTAGFYSGEMFDIDWDALDGHDTIRLTHTVGVERVQRFTTREVAALVAGLQLVAAVPGVADAGTLRDLRAKLARGAGTADRADQVLVDEPVDAARAELARAVQERVEVTFEYRRPGGETTTRTVDPSGPPDRGRPVVPAGLVPPARGDPHVPHRTDRRPRGHVGAGAALGRTATGPVHAGRRRHRRDPAVPDARAAADRGLPRTRRARRARSRDVRADPGRRCRDAPPPGGARGRRYRGALAARREGRRARLGAIRRRTSRRVAGVTADRR